jgi:hypothetical protein
MPHRNALNLDSNDNTAIREEIGERLRVLLSKEQPRPSAHIQHLLDSLSPSDAARGHRQPPPLSLMVQTKGKVISEKQKKATLSLAASFISWR